MLSYARNIQRKLSKVQSVKSHCVCLRLCCIATAINMLHFYAIVNSCLPSTIMYLWKFLNVVFVSQTLCWLGSVHISQTGLKQFPSQTPSPMSSVSVVACHKGRQKRSLFTPMMSTVFSRHTTWHTMASLTTYRLTSTQCHLKFILLFRLRLHCWHRRLVWLQTAAA